MQYYLAISFILTAVRAQQHHGYTYEGSSSNNYNSILSGPGSLGSASSINSVFGSKHNAQRFSTHSEQLIEEPLINKHFYLHSAPEEMPTGPKHFTLGRAQKNYRVLFVRAPISNQPRLAAEYAPNEEKTVVYVLSQKEHEFSPDDIATPAPTQPSKPEVHFIKYNTLEEAAYAQQQIQAQYDSLGGSSDLSDEGTAPLSSVIGSLDNFGNAGKATEQQAASIRSKYLPPRH